MPAATSWQSGALPVNRKALLLAGVVLLLIALLALGVSTRKEATLKVQRAASGAVKMLPDGSLVNFYAAYMENRATRAGIFSLEVAPLPGHQAELIGPVRDLELAANANRKVDLVLRIKPAPKTGREMELRLVSDGKVVAVSPLPVAVE